MLNTKVKPAGKSQKNRLKYWKFPSSFAFAFFAFFFFMFFSFFFSPFEIIQVFGWLT
jgi:hypothetical protein